MKLNELKTGMVAKTQNGELYMVLKNTVFGEDILARIEGNGLLYLKYFNDNLEYQGSPVVKPDPQYNIEEIYKSDYLNSCLTETKYLHRLWKKTNGFQYGDIVKGDKDCEVFIILSEISKDEYWALFKGTQYPQKVSTNIFNLRKVGHVELDNLFEV